MNYQDALVQSLVRQRDAALNASAQLEASLAVSQAETAAARKELEEVRESIAAAAAKAKEAEVAKDRARPEVGSPSKG